MNPERLAGLTRRATERWVGTTVTTLADTGEVYAVKVHGGVTILYCITVIGVKFVTDSTKV